MHPFDHAKSSQLLHGGLASDYQAIHDWFDRTKCQLAHFTHRALRHHVQGAAVAERLFGAEITNSDGVVVSVQALCHQHLDEDCRRSPQASDWLTHLKPPAWMPSEVPDAFTIAAAEARRTNVPPEDILPLSKWMLETASWFGDLRHLAMRHHAWGIFEAEEVFGITMSVGGGHIPTRYLAERHVRRVIGRVPAAADWLRRIEGQPWMVKARHPRDVLRRTEAD